ncbi:hypothetical protein K439DRAFT_1611486 [Ramaria rubella]|nr:hypothetical protein K439DRAFT_1611486 [Ramaria rubella]
MPQLHTHVRLALFTTRLCAQYNQKTSHRTLSPTLQGLIVSSILITGAIFSLGAGYISDRTPSPSEQFFSLLALHCSALRLLCHLYSSAAVSQLPAKAYFCQQSQCGIAETDSGHPRFDRAIICYFVCYGTVWLEAIVATVLAIGAPLLPHSPRWLKAVGKHRDAARSQECLGVSPAEAEKEEETLEREASQHQELVQPPKGLKVFGELFSKDVRYRTLLGCFLMGMNQICCANFKEIRLYLLPVRGASGIDDVLYYALILFTQAGLSSTKASFLVSGVTGIVNIVCTVITMTATDRWGRRPATIGGGFTIAACFLSIGSVYASQYTDYSVKSKGVSLEDFDEVFQVSPWKAWSRKFRVLHASHRDGPTSTLSE